MAVPSSGPSVRVHKQLISVCKKTARAASFSLMFTVLRRLPHRDLLPRLANFSPGAVHNKCTEVPSCYDNQCPPSQPAQPTWPSFSVHVPVLSPFLHGLNQVSRLLPCRPWQKTIACTPGEGVPSVTHCPRASVCTLRDLESNEEKKYQA